MFPEAVARYHDLLSNQELAESSRALLDEGLENAKLIFGGVLERHPDLRIGDEGVVWRDSLGRDHVLSGSKRLTLGEAAQKLNRSVRRVQELAAEGKLGPVLRFSRRDVQLYACCVDDYEHHGLRRKEVAHA